jgi:manganese-dependent inorganic pyrophosphatase
MAERLARIGNITLDEIGHQLFSSSYHEESSLKDIAVRDFKEFHMADQKFGVGQITSYDSENLMERKDELLKIMSEIKTERGYSFILLMVTDVLLGGTYLLYQGSDDIIRNAFQVEPKDHMVFLPGVMSRKKQIIPMLTDLWG